MTCSWSPLPIYNKNRARSCGLIIVWGIFDNTCIQDSLKLHPLYYNRKLFINCTDVVFSVFACIILRGELDGAFYVCSKYTRCRISFCYYRKSAPNLLWYVVSVLCLGFLSTWLFTVIDLCRHCLEEGENSGACGTSHNKWISRYWHSVPA